MSLSIFAITISFYPMKHDGKLPNASDLFLVAIHFANVCVCLFVLFRFFIAFSVEHCLFWFHLQWVIRSRGQRWPTLWQNSVKLSSLYYCHCSVLRPFALELTLQLALHADIWSWLNGGTRGEVLPAVPRGCFKRRFPEGALSGGCLMDPFLRDLNIPLFIFVVASNKICLFVDVICRRFW